MVAGVEYRRSEAAKLTLEGFYKHYNNYPVSVVDSISLANKGGDFGVYGNEEVTSTGTGRAYGFEVYLRDRLMDRLDLIVSYTFVRSEFKDFNDKYVPSAWDNRHLLNTTLGIDLGKNWNLGAKWRFIGGSPFTPWDLNRSSLREAWDARRQGYLDYGRFNTLRTGNAHQLDVRVDKQYFFDRWSFNFYVDIQNAYNFQQEGAPNLTTVTDGLGNDLIDPADPSRYQIKEVVNLAGRLLPTVGIIVEF
ncbi:hypothetical protein DSECCO2_532620 [anaerobic digester metagenome]